MDEIEDELYNLVDTQLKPSSKIKIINLKYFARYSQEAGFKIAIDGLHNLPDKGIYATVYCINPPGSLYSEEKDVSQIQLNSSLDWSSAVKTPNYIEGYVHYRKVTADKAKCLVIDVRKIRVVIKKDKEFFDPEPYGWTILPIFTFDLYVNSGVYQLPLFRGSVNAQILKEVSASTDPWKRMLQISQEKDLETYLPRLQFIYPSSVIVRLVDGQREGHYQIPFDWRRLTQEYLPQDYLFDYSYNEAVEDNLKKEKKLKSLKPDNITDLEFNMKITKFIINKFELVQFTEPAL